MTLPSRSAPLLLVLAACATAGGGGRDRTPAAPHQADERIPPIAAFEPVEQRSAYGEALAQEQRGWQAESAGKADEARAPLEAAARGYLAFVERFEGTGWDLTFRYHAADLLRRAQRHDEAAALAEQVANDARSSPKSRAMALLQVSNALMGAGKLEPLRVRSAQERGGEPPSPRPAPEPWRRFVEATDAYLASLSAERPEPDDRRMSAPQLALVAARVAYATDDLPGARRRLAAILERWADDAQVFQAAAPLYVQTFLVERDLAGAEEAVERLGDTAAAQAERAQEAGARAAYEKVAEEADRVGAGVRFEQAKLLLDEGKAAESAKAFEALAEEGGDVAAALSGAAVAWDRAGDRERAAALRTRILAEHGDSRVAPQAALQLAAFLAKKRDHVESGRVYGHHADTWPDDPNHCTALRNGAVELDLAKRAADAAARYQRFGTEPRCAEDTPDVAALALHRAGELFLVAKRRADAGVAFSAAAEVKGVESPDAKARVADAKAQAKRLAGAAGQR